MHPFDAALKALNQANQIRTVPPLRAEVLAQAGDKLELRLLLAQDRLVLWELDAGLQQVPLFPAGGLQLQLAPGAQVIVLFLGGDPKDPVAYYLSGTILSATLSASTSATIGAPLVSVGDTGGAVRLAGGTRPVLRGGIDGSGDKVSADGKLIDSKSGPCTGYYDTDTPGTVLA